MIKRGEVTKGMLGYFEKSIITKLEEEGKFWKAMKKAKGIGFIRGNTKK